MTQSHRSTITGWMPPEQILLDAGDGGRRSELDTAPDPATAAAHFRVAAARVGG